MSCVGGGPYERLVSPYASRSKIAIRTGVSKGLQRFLSVLSPYFLLSSSFLFLLTTILNNRTQ